MMRCQNSADQLIGVVNTVCHGKLVYVEDRPQVLVSKNQVSPSSLKGTFCQLRLNEEMAQAHINFGSVGTSADQWCPHFNAELWPQPWLSPEKSAEGLSSGHAWIAENVHQKCIGTVRTIKFPPCTVARSRDSLAGRVALLQPASPVGRGANAPIGCWQKVAVFTIYFLIQNAGNVAKGRFVNDTLRTVKTTGAQLATKARGR